MREGQIIRTPEEELAISKKFKWPTVRVDSEQFGRLPLHEQFRQLALGNLRSAKILCTQLGENPDDLTWPRGTVVCYCYLLAIELFLKSCIHFRGRDIAKFGHDIDKLKKQYLNLHPDKAFDFQTPWSLSMDDIEKEFGAKPDMEDFEKKHDQVYRYLRDKEGHPAKGLYNFAPGCWLWMIERLEDDIDRIWANIQEAYGSTEPS